LHPAEAELRTDPGTAPTTTSRSAAAFTVCSDPLEHVPITVEFG
jgi:hypothetical protein